MNNNTDLQHVSSTQKGDSFRDLVADLLRTQYPDAGVEERIGGTKIDIVFTKYEFGSYRKFAVECKDYESPLTKSYIAQNIYTVYNPLIDSNDIDAVIVVSKKPLGADAAAYFKNWRGATHQTYEQLAESLLGLRRYIENLATGKGSDDSLYIEGRIDGQEGFGIDVIDRWVSTPGSNAVAILGGYGQGKTSFAKRVAAEFGKRYIADPTSRLPILLRLGEVVHETQLEALFGKEFTSKNRADGYRFETLEHLNRQGRLLIILDGFDEMKHAMTSNDFQANFMEFNRLLKGKAKVVLLGRPNALPSDERELVFRGKTKVADSTIASSLFNPWSEWKLAFFTHEEATQLLQSHLSSLVNKYSTNVTYKYDVDFVRRRVDEIFIKVPSDLLKRPVHVALVAEVGADPSFDFDGFNEYKLYSHFISSMVERDTRDKPARREIPLAPRLAFQRELAWWAWKRVGTTQGCFFRHEVPSELFENLPDGKASDLEGKRNEYIVSTLTEEKESGVLFFAHRSFQEYLTAERLRLHPSTPSSHADYSAFLTPDIISFLRQAPTSDYIFDWYESLRSNQFPLPISYLSFFASFSILLEHIRKNRLNDESLDVWTTSILILSNEQKSANRLESTAFFKLLTELIASGSPNTAAVAVLGLLACYRKERDPDKTILIRIVGALIKRCLIASRPVAEDRSALTFEKRNFDFAASWLSTEVRRIFPSSKSTELLMLSFSVSNLEILCKKSLTNVIRIAYEEIETPNLNPYDLSKSNVDVDVVSVQTSKALEHIDKPLLDGHSRFFNSRTLHFNVVQVDNLKRGFTY
jgi:NACHT domain/Restriction endonuclease